MAEDSGKDLADVLTVFASQPSWSAHEIIPLAYEELRLLARGQRRAEHRPPSLQTTELVHESYLRLLQIGQDKRWNSLSEFFMAACRIMRQILIDRARARRRQKRGGGWSRRAFEAADLPVIDDGRYDLIDLDEALEKLQQHDALLARIVQLRFFGGLTVEQTAELLEIAPGTVSNHWRYARGWLLAQLEQGAGKPELRDRPIAPQHSASEAET